MKKTISVAAASLATLTGFACSSSSSEMPPATPPVEDAGADATDRAPVFGACPTGYVSECATVQEPLDHAAPGGETIDFHIARYPAATQPAKRQVWLFAGGPGQAGYAFGRSLPAFAASMPDADLYVPDHRGTGHSHRLTCPQQDVEGTIGGLNLRGEDTQACLEALEKNGDYMRLPYFTATQAAEDVLDAIARTKKPEQKVYAWGVSYGTHLAHRIMQIDPNALDGAVFDGFLTPHHFSFSEYDRGAQEVGDAFAAMCDRDTSCSTHLGTGGTPGGAMAKVRAVLDKLATTPCAGLDKANARTVLSLLVDSWTLRALVFPTVHRLDRCSAADRTALKAMIDAYNELAGAAFETPFLNSGVLQYNITAWELWTRPGQQLGTKEEVLAAANGQAFLQGRSVAGEIYDVRSFWPKPPDDYSRYPVPVTTRTKQLWLGGELDLHTYPSQTKMLSSVYPGASYVLLKDASHTPSRQSPLAADMTKTCGLEILTKFIAGDGLVDTSCTAAMAPAIFEAKTSDYAKRFWNTADDWGDGTPKP